MATSGYGSWKSPITSDLIVAGSLQLGALRLDSDTQYWLEGRPQEGGRNVIVQQGTHGTKTDFTPPGFNVRTRVHEYGGAAYIVRNGTVYFSNFADQRLYVQKTAKEAPQPLTEDFGDSKMRYADGIIDEARNQLICVREDHTGGGEAVNSIVAISLSNGSQTVLTEGYDFYSSPRLNTSGTKLVYLCWKHPDMPWDGTELWQADITDTNSLSNSHKIAGSRTEALCQPEWSPQGVLYFVSDRTDWWNIYRYNDEDKSCTAMCPKTTEFGFPHWSFGLTTYGFQSEECIICSWNQDGKQHLSRLNTKTSEVTDLPCDCTSISLLRVNANAAMYLAGYPTKASGVVVTQLSDGSSTILQQSTNMTVPEPYISTPQRIEFPSQKDKTSFGVYYPPRNGDFIAPEGELPPLLVKIHGGPTSATSTNFDLKKQYWTSRGIAILDVDYGGSTGYGRAYRERLKPNWGIVDVDDCVSGANYLVEKKLADPKRLLIDGGSAGGYTTLAALAFRDTFSAGASHYGVSDIEALAKDTHKFESRYLDSLIGPYPDAQVVYKERSPINSVDKLGCPVIFFQGDEDKVVPPNQSAMMAEALKEKGLPVAYVLFEGEQHGFRKAENIRRALDGELYFYSKVFKFPLADEVAPLPIDNLQ